MRHTPSNDNIINVHKNIESVRMLVKNKKRSVRLRIGEAQLNKKLFEFMILGTGGLFETI